MTHLKLMIFSKEVEHKVSVSRNILYGSYGTYLRYIKRKYRSSKKMVTFYTNKTNFWGNPAQERLGEAA